MCVRSCIPLYMNKCGCVASLSLSLSLFLHASTINKARRAVHCATSTILTKILINVITSVRCVFSRRENSCQTVTSVSQIRIVRTFLKTLILISRCENDVDIAFVDGMRPRLESPADKPIFSDNARHKIFVL